MIDVARDRFVSRLWQRDASLWSQDPSAQQTIRDRLGWLTAAEWTRERLGELRRFAESIHAGRLTDVVLLGMGGSSLAPEVLKRIAGTAAGWPRFTMLDSTDPGAIRRVERAIDPDRTLFVLASKSGSTIEPKPEAVAGEFLRWEVATATAGALLGVNPFDEPDVRQAKEATGALLDAYKKDGRLPAHPADITEPLGTLALSEAARQAVKSAWQLLSLLRGPLIRTGGTAPAQAAERPGRATTGVLERAQAVGDFLALERTGRRVLHIHLPAPDAGALRKVFDRLVEQLLRA